ncbi:hypothetical protein XGA_1869 [Xanthomonas hortorum ATCC 19865]|nr:hypothetical protein XGA_1869 [Xanthomonas hortorum ATCC 19865]
MLIAYSQIQRLDLCKTWIGCVQRMLDDLTAQSIAQAQGNNNTKGKAARTANKVGR